MINYMFAIFTEIVLKHLTKLVTLSSKKTDKLIVIQLMGKYKEEFQILALGL